MDAAITALLWASVGLVATMGLALLVALIMAWRSR